MSYYPTHCPKCRADFQGAPIPQEYIDEGYFDPGVTHYSRLIGVEESEIYDGIIRWRCPDCKHEWPVKGMEMFSP